MKLIQRREYITDRPVCGGLLYKHAILHDWLIPSLGITAARYVGSRFGIRLQRRRVAVDCGRYAFLFWGLAPRAAA